MRGRLWDAWGDRGCLQTQLLNEEENRGYQLVNLFSCINNAPLWLMLRQALGRDRETVVATCPPKMCLLFRCFSMLAAAGVWGQLASLTGLHVLLLEHVDEPMIVGMLQLTALQQLTRLAGTVFQALPGGEAADDTGFAEFCLMSQVGLWLVGHCTCGSAHVCGVCCQ